MIEVGKFSKNLIDVRVRCQYTHEDLLLRKDEAQQLIDKLSAALQDMDIQESNKEE
tara:strand:- start:50034 stop:50201 length:168 start_codon:yes stop_codon:yes gene_type:complete